MDDLARRKVHHLVARVKTIVRHTASASHRSTRSSSSASYASKAGRRIGGWGRIGDVAAERAAILGRDATGLSSCGAQQRKVRLKD